MQRQWLNSIFFGILFYAFPAVLYAQQGARPNIVIVLCDDCGYGDLGSYGNTTFQTPNLDSMADQGLRFTQYYANAAVCSPSRAAILTGQYPQRFGILAPLSANSPAGIPETTKTLAELLKEAGYATYHLGKWHVGQTKPEYLPMAKGYNGFFGFLNGKNSYRNPFLRRNDGTKTQYMGDLTEILTNEAASIISSSPEPFFIMLWHFSVHTPLQPQEEWLNQYPNLFGRKRAYAAMLSALDNQIGRVMQALRDRGIDNNTLVVFTSDNGGARQMHQSGNGNLSGFKFDLHEGGIREPFLALWPAYISPGQVNDSFVLGFDLLPTLVEFAGVDAAALPLDGQNRAPAFLGSFIPDREQPVVWKTASGSYAVRKPIGTTAWKLVHRGSRNELYKIREDPTESNNVIDTNVGIFAELVLDYQNWELAVGQ